MFRIVKGSTLLVPSGPARDRDRLHFHVCLTDPFVDAGDNDTKVVLASICTIPPEGQPYDATCMLEPGEHAFITRKSYVYYAMAVPYSVSSLAKRCRSGVCERRDPIETAVLARMLKGAINSVHTKKRIVGLCRVAYRGLEGFDDDLPF
jgi:hypothetical protein